MPKRVSLGQLAKQVFADPELYQNLRRSPATAEATLSSAGFELAPPDLEKLMRALVEKVYLKLPGGILIEPGLSPVGDDNNGNWQILCDDAPRR